MVTLPTYYICLICTAIEPPAQGGHPAQGANKVYVILLPEATYVSQNGFFALLIAMGTPGLLAEDQDEPQLNNTF